MKALSAAAMRELAADIEVELARLSQLLERMSQDREGRPAVLTRATAGRLREFLGFRHIVRNLYGFELEPERIAALVENYPAVWSNVRNEVATFVDWLSVLAAEITKS